MFKVVAGREEPAAGVAATNPSDAERALVSPLN